MASWRGSSQEPLTDLIYPGNMATAIEELPMNPAPEAAYIAFEGDRCIGSGDLREVARSAKAGAWAASAGVDPDLQRPAPARRSRSIFAARSTTCWRGSRRRRRRPRTKQIAVAAPRGPGRPKLGVVAREITLLPRHWDWLAQQNGGASVVIRRLVDEARRNGEDGDRIRLAQEAAYRFMSTMAGNRPHFEEAIRALFANDRDPFRKIDRRMARRCARPRGQARRIRISARKLSRTPVDPAVPTR